MSQKSVKLIVVLPQSGMISLKHVHDFVLGKQTAAYPLTVALIHFPAVVRVRWVEAQRPSRLFGTSYPLVARERSTLIRWTNNVFHSSTAWSADARRREVFMLESYSWKGA